MHLIGFCVVCAELGVCGRIADAHPLASTCLALTSCGSLPLGVPVLLVVLRPLFRAATQKTPRDLGSPPCERSRVWRWCTELPAASGGHFAKNALACNGLVCEGLGGVNVWVIQKFEGGGLFFWMVNRTIASSFLVSSIFSNTNINISVRCFDG